MGLTILAFLSVPGFAALFFIVLRRGRSSPAGRSVAAIAVALTGYSLAQGFVFILTGPGFPQIDALFLERLSGSLMILTHFLLLIFALNFPTPLPNFVQRMAWILALPVAVFAAYEAAFTLDYIVSVYRPWTTIFRTEGQAYTLIVFGSAAMGALSSAVLFLRALASKDRVQKQRAAVAAGFILIGVLLVFVSTGLLTTGTAKRPSYVFAPIGALVLAGGAGYAFRLSRLFDWRAIRRTLLGYGALLGVVGLPAGLAMAVLVLAGRATTPVLPAIGAIAIFLGGSILGRLFFARFFERLGARYDYREKLEADLAKADLSQGRDAVLAEVYGLLSKALDFTDFTVLLDDDQSFMRTIFAPTGGRATVARGSAVCEFLETSGANVVLKSDVLADPSFDDIRPALLELFESLKAEAIVVIMEGSRSMGMFGLGARSTGGEYTAYDYDAFKAIYGKLFVIAYYLKNIARESIMTTVDREIALSDQIVRFALERVDRIEHPKADSAWIAKSARSLGGDFIDFVKLSADRWFVVMGDVSGKGLSASMNMLILKSMIRTFLRVEKDFVSLVSRVNAFIKANLPKGTFFAGVFGYLDLAKDAFYYINCGVPAILLYSPSFETFIDVQGEGRILGFVKDVAPYLKPRKLSLTAGSAIVTSTDGILDSENLRGERFGKERLRRSVVERLQLTAAEITKGVMDDFAAFTDQRQDDDVTLFVLKLGGTASKPAVAAKPVATARPTEAAKPVAGVAAKPGAAAKPAAGASPAEANKPAEPAKPRSDA
jgi:hypothetical protein